MKTIHNVTLLFALLLLVGAAAWAERPVDRTVPAPSNAEVSIENVAGSVRVSGWNRDEVQVTGTLGDEVKELAISTHGNVVEIEVKLTEGSHKGEERKIAADLEVRVPAGSHVSAETVSAAITAGDLSGELDLKSVSGAVEVSGEPTALEVSTVSGGIHLDGLRTAVDADTVSGKVSLAGVSGEVEVNSVSGRIEVEAAGIERGDLQSVSGGIELRGDLEAGAHLEIQSHSGDVTLDLGAGVSASFDVQTFSGEIDNQLGPSAEREGHGAPGKHLRFSTGGGSARVSIQTFSGNVKLQ